MPKLSDEVKAKRKTKILDAAFIVFSAQGYTSTTIDHISIESGVSKGGIYTYYASKEEIFLEIATLRFKKRSALFSTIKREHLNQNGFINYEVLIRDYLKSVLISLTDPEVLNTAKFSFEFWSIVTRDPALKQLANSRYSDFYSDLTLQIAEGIRAGFFNENINMEAIGYILLSTLDGMMHTHVIMGIPLPNSAIDHYIDAIMSLLLV